MHAQGRRDHNPVRLGRASIRQHFYCHQLPDASYQLGESLWKRGHGQICCRAVAKRFLPNRSHPFGGYEEYSFSTGRTGNFAPSEYSPTPFRPLLTFWDLRLHYSSNERMPEQGYNGGVIKVSSTYLQDDSIPDCSFAKNNRK